MINGRRVQNLDFVTLIATHGQGTRKQRAILVMPVVPAVFDDAKHTALIRDGLLIRLDMQARNNGLDPDDGQWSYEWFRGDGRLDPYRALIENRELKPLPW